ncbi:hypothetical protein ES703_102460 [subsurface metagenome]
MRTLLSLTIFDLLLTIAIDYFRFIIALSQLNGWLSLRAAQRQSNLDYLQVRDCHILRLRNDSFSNQVQQSTRYNLELFLVFFVAPRPILAFFNSK